MLEINCECHNNNKYIVIIDSYWKPDIVGTFVSLGFSVFQIVNSGSRFFSGKQGAFIDVTEIVLEVPAPKWFALIALSGVRYIFIKDAYQYYIYQRWFRPELDSF